MPLPVRRLLPSPYHPGCSKNVFGRISDSFLRYTVRRQCKSSALAAVDSDKQPKRQKITKNERHAMVEAFIAKYRQSNAGKLPSVKHVQQMVGGSYYVIRDIVQEIEYSHKFAVPKKIGTVHLGKTDEPCEQNSDLKEENSISNLYVSYSFSAVQPNIEDKVGEQLLESEETSVSNEYKDIIGKTIFHSSEREELSTVSVAESKVALLDEQGCNAKAESSTCTVAEDKEIEIHVSLDPKEGLSSRSGHKDEENVIKGSVAQAEPSICSIAKDEAVEVDYGLDTKEGLLSCSEDKDKEDVTRSFDSKGESAADDGDEILQYSSKSKDECLVSDTLNSHSSEFVAKKDAVEGSLSMNDTRIDANARSSLEEHANECPKKHDVVKKSDEDSPMGLLNNLRSIKDKIFSFWKNL